MKRNSTKMKITLNGKHMAGGMLLEVVLAIAVFAFGMLALVQLQGNLTRSSTDANTRTVATNIAEEIVEAIRGFRAVQADAGTTEKEYLELFGTELSQTVPRGGMNYAVTVEISDFWRDEANDTFVSTPATEPPTVPAEADGLAFASFKLLKIDVAWNTSQDFYVDDDNTAVLGPGNITIYEIIPSSPPSLGAKIAADPNSTGGGPAVDYTPGLKPDTVALKLDGSQRLKESTKPTPDVIRSGLLTETSFDVVTYNSSPSNTFLRREEFVTVGCECTLDSSPDEGEGGFRPTVWNGVDYTAGEFVSKNFGTSANNQQSVFCDVCCRDHHDGGSGDLDVGYEKERLVYNPWNPDVNHKHYSKSKKGELTLAGDGDVYVEACRLIRKDGFFRVAHDFNKQGFFGFANDYLDNDFEVTEYSNYVLDAVDDLYATKGNTDLKQPGPPLKFTDPATGSTVNEIPASSPNTATNLPLPIEPYSEEQQLRSRGIYIDYLTDEARAKITICKTNPASCPLPGYTIDTELALFYPFFDVQLTSLSVWREEIPNVPVHVTSEPIETNNMHSRGLAELMTTERDQSDVFLEIQDGNVGIAAVDPIVPAPGLLLAAAAVPSNMYIKTTGSPAEYVGTRVEGTIVSGVGGVRAADIDIRFNEAQCGQTSTGYTCIYPELANAPTLTVFNYYKANQTLYACSLNADDVEALAVVGVVHGADNSTTFDLTSYTGLDANIVIQNSPCGA